MCAAAAALFFLLYPYFEAYGLKRAARFRVLLAVAVVIAIVGALNPWSDGWLSRAPFIANIEELSANLHGLGHFACWHYCAALMLGSVIRPPADPHDIG